MFEHDYDYEHEHEFLFAKDHRDRGGARGYSRGLEIYRLPHAAPTAAASGGGDSA